MNEFLIELQAKLNEEASKGNINKNIDNIQKDIKLLQLQAEIDKDSISKLVKQIEIIIGQKIVIPNIDLNPEQAIKTAEQAGQEISKKITNAINQETNGSLLNDKSFQKSFKTINDAKKEFQNLLKNENDVITTMEKFDSNNNLDSFTVNIKRASGEIDSLNYKLKNAQFEFTGGKTNDSGAKKQTQQIENIFADYTQKYAQFKSTNNNILSGLTTPLSDFENKLNGLKKGISTIDEVKNSFKLLNAEASNITANISGQLNKIDSAIRNIDKGEKTIAGLQAEIKGLSNAPIEINRELEKLTSGLLNIKNIEATEGRTVNWSKAYEDWQQAVKSLTDNLSVLKKEQSNSATTQIFNTTDLNNQGKIYIQEVSNTIEKAKFELESKLRNAGYMDIEIKGIEAADGKVKSLTASVTDATGAFKRLNFERAKIENNGKTQSGFIQTDDVKIIGNISSVITGLQDKLSSLKLKWENQGILVGEFKAKVEELETSLSSVGNKGELHGLEQQIQHLKLESSIITENNRIQASIDIGDYDKKFETLKTYYEKLGLTSNEIKAKTEEVAVALDKLKEKNLDTLIQDEKDFNEALRKSQNEAIILKTDLDSIYNSKRQEKLTNDIQDWLSKNTKASKDAKQSLKEYYDELSNGRVSISRLNEIEKELKNIDTVQKKLGKVGKSFVDQLKGAGSSFTQWASISSSIMLMVSKTKEAITELKSLDNILTEISKTSDLTEKELKQLGDSSFESASKYGKTASDYLTGVQDMSQSGFYGEKGAAMAEQALLAQAAGDMTAEIANNYILATNAAYKYNGEAEKLNAVLDGQNSITNRNSVALEDMAIAMSEAGTVASSYHVSIEDLSAMIGTIEAVTKSGGSEVGNSIKSILVNLQNISSDKITTTLNKANASMTEFIDGTEKLRNPITILRDLAVTFNQLDENDPLRAEILTNIAGKYQAAKLAALLQNVELFDKMLVDYSEGSGSAMEEAMKSASNWEGSLNRLNNTWTKIINNFVNSDGIITIINSFNSLLSIVDTITEKLGLLGNIGVASGFLMNLNGIGKCINFSGSYTVPALLRLHNNAM